MPVVSATQKAESEGSLEQSLNLSWATKQDPIKTKPKLKTTLYEETEKWLCMSVTSTPMKLKPKEHHKFEVSLEYIMSSRSV